MIHLFFKDNVFLNRFQSVAPLINTGSLGVLSALAESYFSTPMQLIDNRTTRQGTAATFHTVPYLVVDKDQFAQFVTEISGTWTDGERKQLFDLAESVLLTIPNANDATLRAHSIYVPGSVNVSNHSGTSFAYIDANTSVSITSVAWVSFSVNISAGTTYDIQIWLDNATFESSYPISKVVAVVPPLPIVDLYNLDIVEATDNVFTTALKSSMINMDVLDNVMPKSEYSGYVAQDVKFVDPSHNYKTVQFNILYKGKVPGILAVRAAIRSLLLTSGIGSRDTWAAKCPELFIAAAYYLIPMWDKHTDLIDRIIYPSMVSVASIESSAKAVMYDEATSLVTTNLCTFVSSYNTMVVAAVPGDTNPTGRVLLTSEHPTYQYYSSTDPGFTFMADTTKQFAILLAKALSAAAGNMIDEELSISVLNDRNFITFTVSDVEYLVITKASYLTLLGV